jgi:predicted PurR-regulated permease PerM
MLIWLVAFIVYQQVQDRVVQPLLYGRAVKVNPLIAIPVAASIAVVFKVLQPPRPADTATGDETGEVTAEARTQPA